MADWCGGVSVVVVDGRSGRWCMSCGVADRYGGMSVVVAEG